MVLPEPVGALPQTSRPGEGVGERGGLHRERLGDAEDVEALAQAGGHAEVGEGGGQLGGSPASRGQARVHTRGVDRRGADLVSSAAIRTLLLGGSLKPQLDTARQRLLAHEHCTGRRRAKPPLGSAGMEPVMARKMWRTLEPYHGLIYFAPEATAAYEALGVMGCDGYFASRAAPMGAVPAEVVIATFFNFNPELVHAARSLPRGTSRRRPSSSTRGSSACDAALRRALGDRRR